MHVMPHYTLPPLVSTFDPGSVAGLTQTANPKAASGSGTNTSNPGSDGGLGATFLNLLATELQNQDPTNPVDSTAMVGQMISLNQLDQLISINQALTGSSTSSGASGSAQPAAGAPLPASTSSGAAPSAAPSASPKSLPFDPTTMMPLDPALMPPPINSSTTHTAGGK